VLGSAAVVATGVVIAVLVAGLGVFVITTSMRSTRRPTLPGLLRGTAYIFVGVALAFQLRGLVVVCGVFIALAIGAFVAGAATPLIIRRSSRHGAGDLPSSVPNNTVSGIDLERD
jgi:hypothetical protein